MPEYIIPSVRTFCVFPDLPEPLKPLLDLARNFWWVWQPDAIKLFRRLDPELWEQVYHNPIKLLGQISQARFAELAVDAGLVAQVDRVNAQFKKHLAHPGWYSSAHADQPGLHVAYFSAEFGVHESLPIYSGGLGILAGDHLKSASELGMPLIGVGLLYRQGYFQQYLSQDGWQQESYPELDFYNLAIEQQRYANGSPVRVRVDLPDNPVLCNVWKASIGRIGLYLLDTNLPENAPIDRDITSRLYGGGTELRIKQEMVLGIGGIRAIHALSIPATVFHMNEGHSAFSALERIRVLLEKYPNLSFDQVRQMVMATSIFTTHTPVPAGIDMFTPELMIKYFSNYWPSLKLNEEGFLALGREDVFNAKQGFSMAVLAIRLADGVNGVSKLHGEVSRLMWHNLWPQVPPEDVPIKSVTNGIHIHSWLSPEIASVLDQYLGEKWKDHPTDESVWENVSRIPDEALWQAHERSRERLVGWTRQTFRRQLEKRNVGIEQITLADQILDPEALTIGFARRFATYKRGALLLRDSERLKKLLAETSRPIQFIFAGKAHPADNDGKELIRAITNFAAGNPQISRRMVFLENYDINLARYLVQGVDVWLNTPRRGMEASGTSGMKAAANGIPNCSILDGWWVEGYSADVGWAIGRGEEYTDSGYQDHIESIALYDLLEKQIIPEFYNRGTDKIPRQWIARMKQNIRKLAPQFSTNRMVQEYCDHYYVPAITRGQHLAANNLARAIALADDKNGLRSRWGGIRIVGVHTSGNGHFKVGESMQVEAMIDLPGIKAEDVKVQLYCGPASATGNIQNPQTLVMKQTEQMAPDRHIFTGKIDCVTSGRHGFAVRVLPGNADLATPFEPGLILWS